MNRLSILTVFALTASGPVAHALTFGKNPVGFRTFEASRQHVSAHPFSLDSMLDHRGSLLLQAGQVDFDEAVAMHLRNRLKNPVVQIRSSKSGNSMGLTGGRESYDYRFYVNGIPLCEYHVRAHELSDRSVFMLGNVPDVDSYDAGPSEWPDFNQTWVNVTASIRQESGQNSIQLRHRSKCLLTANQRLMPVWKVKVDAGGLPYYALADAYETVSFEAGFFDIDKTASVFEHNILSGSLQNVTLKDLSADGTMHSTYLKTVIPSGWTRIQSTSTSLEFPTTDKRFEELQAYANAQRHFDYFASIGFQWYGPAPLELRLHVKPQGRANNALFMPGSDFDGSLPSISIDDGDGEELRNLVTDSDVMSHEFGHHVIYKTLRKVDGESLVLHEGLADFFAFARTSDGCLGESICPEKSGACIVENQCLRTSVNNLKYDDATWNQWAGARYRLGHLHGQLISGMLWDLLKSGDVPVEDLPKLVLQAISYFQESSGFRDLMLGLFTADKELYGSKYGEKIKAAAEARNLGEFFSDVDLTKEIPKLEGTDGAANLPASEQPAENKEESGNENIFNKCGSIAGDTPSGGYLILILALLLPLTLRLRSAQPVKVRTKPQDRNAKQTTRR